MKRITITVPEALADEFAQTARHRGISVPEAVRGFVETALRAELGPDRRRAIQWLGMVSKGGWPGGADVDEYLAMHWAKDIGDGWSELGDDGAFDREAAQKRQDEMDRIIGAHWAERDAARHQRG